MESAVNRLERVASRLETLEDKFRLFGSSRDADPVAVTTNGVETPSVKAWDDLITSYYLPFSDTTGKIGGKNVKDQLTEFSKVNDGIRQLILKASQSKEPALEKVGVFLKGSVIQFIQKINDIREKSRSDKQWEHISALNEAVQYFTWVGGAPTPGERVNNSLESSQFWTNKILRIYKGKDEQHVNWCNQLSQFLKQIHIYIKQWHTTGLTWSSNGTDFIEISIAQSESAQPSCPPPPPPANNYAETETKSTVPDTNALFASLNKGADITSGLKKVTKDMQTHKNPNLRASGGVIKSTSKKVTLSKTQYGAAMKKHAPKGPVLEGNKWVVVCFSFSFA